MPHKPPHQADPAFNPDVEIELTCREGAVSVLPGQSTRVRQYVGKLLKGPANALTVLPESYLGPLMRFRTGQKVRIHLRNELNEPTITHWHGLNVPALMDGHPSYAIDKGQTFVYEFEVRNRASMILYHPHTHGVTGEQVYHGLAGAILINDGEEDALNLPSGEYEIPIVIQDRMFDDQNQLVYARNMHDRMIGFHGDRILVNGRPDFSVDVASRAYRLRILNGSNARIYKLGWSDNSPITVIGVDGGLLETPVHKPYLMLGPGERLDVWADFTGHSIGTQLVMHSRPFQGVLPKMAMAMMKGDMGGMMNHGGESQSGGGHNMGGMGGMMSHGGESQSGGSHNMGGMGGMMSHGGESQSGGGHNMGGMGGMMNHGGESQSGGEHKMGGMGGMMNHGGESQSGGGHKMGGMMGQMANKIPLGSDYPLFTIRVTRTASDSPKLPGQLSKIQRYQVEDTANPSKPVPLGISEAPMAMLLNGRPYAYNDVQPDERIPYDTIQLMEIFHAHGGGGGHGGSSGGHGGESTPGAASSSSAMSHGSESGSASGGHSMGGSGGMGGMGGMGGGMMMSMAHPIHIHEQPFQIVSRTIGAEEAEDYATVKDGFINSGWKDTVLVMPGERVKIVKPFKDYKGLFMVHCHNLEHEDMGMMRELLVE